MPAQNTAESKQDTPPEILTHQAAASQIFDLLPAEDDSEDIEEVKADASEDAEGEQDDDQSGDDERVEDEKRDADEDEDVDDKPAKKPAKKPSDQPRTYRLPKEDGTEEEVTAAEVKARTLRQQDYTRKTQALADDKKAFDADKARTKQAEQDYAERIRQLDDHLARMEDDAPNWDDIRKNDPDGFPAAFAAHQLRKEQREKVRTERQRVDQQQRDESNRQHQEYVRREFEQLVEHLPELKDAKVGRGVLRSIYDNAEQQYGFSREELQNTSDHRAIRMAHDAMKYRDMVAKADEVKDKGKSAPTLKPGAPQKQQDSKKATFDGALQRVRRTGRVNDAASAIERILQ